MKKIAIISYGGLPLPPVRGGAVENLTQFFVDDNEQRRIADLTVFSSYDKDAERESQKYKNTRYVYIPHHKIAEKITGFTNRVFRKLGFGSAFRVYPYLTDVLKVIKQSDFDCIIVENRADFASRLLKKVNIPIVFHAHNDYLDKRYYCFDEKVFDGCSRVIAVSDYVKRCILTHKKKGDNVGVLRNVIDVDSFASVAPDARERMREKYSIRPDDFVFAYVGRVTKGKGVTELIEAFSKVAAKHANARLLVVGAEWFGASAGGEYIKELLSSAECIKDRIVFTGYVDYRRIAEQYAAADAVVVPSIAGEACGLVVLEAMASGKALIVSDSGGIPEHVDAECAITVTRSNGFVAGLECAMDTLVSRPDLARHMGAQGARRAVMYDKTGYLERLMKLIDE